MPRPLRFAAVCLLSLASVSLSAQRTPVVAGTVSLDRLSLALRENFIPAAGVTVRAWKDDGDQQPAAGDALVDTAKTNAEGIYLLKVTGPGDYWITVDSKSFGVEKAWPEQTFGPAGSLCAHPDGTTRSTAFEGSCFGGRSGSRSDEPSTLVTAEHVARVTLAPRSDGSIGSLTGVDFAFSYDAVTTAADGESIQGSVRQFLRNAALVAGPNRMRFVPLEKPNETRETSFGVPPRWWRLTLSSAAPEITDADTILDGTAYNFLSAASVANVHPGRIGEPATVKEGEVPVARLEKPELELVTTGAAGIVCSARCVIRAIAIHGSPTSVIARAPARFEHVLIGASPDGEPADVRGETGVQLDAGSSVARNLFVSSQSRIGILVGREAKLQADRLEVTRCGDPQTGGGVVLLSSGSSIRNSNISANLGAGIILGSLNGASPANGNTIDSSTISSNQAGVVIAPASVRNAIIRNDIVWNRFGGITIAPYENRTPPVENRISMNRYDENGLRPIVLNLAVDDPNQLAFSTSKCDRDQNVANGGLSVPRITSVRVIDEEAATARAIVRGQACPGQIVELYQSFVTSRVRDKAADLPRVRRSESDQGETITSDERTMRLPSIGEFNYLGATNTAADGTFEATFPLTVVRPMDREFDSNDEETNVWATEVLPFGDAGDRAFSAVAIDAAGNTSEMSVRRKVD
jgi:hypothetical protein